MTYLKLLVIAGATVHCSNSHSDSTMTTLTLCCAEPLAFGALLHWHIFSFIGQLIVPLLARGCVSPLLYDVVEKALGGVADE